MILSCTICVISGKLLTSLKCFLVDSESVASASYVSSLTKYRKVKLKQSMETVKTNQIKKKRKELWSLLMEEFIQRT